VGVTVLRVSGTDQALASVLLRRFLSSTYRFTMNIGGTSAAIVGAPDPTEDS